MFAKGDRVTVVRHKGAFLSDSIKKYHGMEGTVVSSTSQGTRVQIDKNYRRQIPGASPDAWTFYTNTWELALIDEPIEPEDWS